MPTCRPDCARNPAEATASGTSVRFEPDNHARPVLRAARHVNLKVARFAARFTFETPQRPNPVQSEIFSGLPDTSIEFDAPAG
jgi:hypothetical protein